MDASSLPTTLSSGLAPHQPTQATNLLSALAAEFTDLKNIDKVASVQAKVDAVTGVMQKNIESALKNTDRIEVRDGAASGAWAQPWYAMSFPLIELAPPPRALSPSRTRARPHMLAGH